MHCSLAIFTKVINADDTDGTSRQAFAIYPLSQIITHRLTQPGSASYPIYSLPHDNFTSVPDGWMPFLHP